MKVKKLLLTLAILFISISLHAGTITPEKLLGLERMSGFELSPDGSMIAFVISKPDIENNHSTSQIYLMTSEGKDIRQITTTGDHNFSPKWSPDGLKLAFISTREGCSQIYVLSFLGGEPNQITEMKGGVSHIDWSPDGKYLSFTSEVSIGETWQDKYQDLDNADAMIFDELPVRHWDRWRDEMFRHLFIIPSEGGEAVDLMEGQPYETPLQPFGGSSQIDWSPDSKEIAYTSKKSSGLEFVKWTNSEVYVVDINSKEEKNITEGMPGFDMDPLYSPDGRYIAFHSQERAGFESDRVRLMIYDRNSGKIKELSKNLDQWVGRTIWMHDSKSLLFSAGHNDGTLQIYQIDVNTSKFNTLTSGKHNFGMRGIDVSPDGKRIFYTKEDYNHPPELYVLKSGNESKISNVNDFSEIDECKYEARWIESTDGEKVHTWVVYPPNFDPNKKYPMITYCQGGPQQMISQYFSTGWSFLTMASKGYIVVAPNRRGCPGFGQDWVDAISQDYGGQPMQDILAATDAMAKEKYVDKEKMAAIGASAGGYAVFWLAGNHNGRFSAFISHCGMFNMVSKYGSTEELWFPNWDNGGPYWENPEYYEVHSPHMFCDKWDTPIFIITGAKDYRVPYTQSLEAFTCAQAQEIPSKLLYYPNEHHWVVHPQEKILWYREFFGFLDKYLGK